MSCVPNTSLNTIVWTDTENERVEAYVNDYCLPILYIILKKDNMVSNIKVYHRGDELDPDDDFRVKRRKHEM